eukprot:gnl/MRDRNA2_/MRDRNA2_75862_c0_seq1.p1 gnl/MRDRNA2_/MRDRNA2_75862_c0~~gnl/MRDRNA2_/MRDRNA2_75862_c0_seq1.p1  ORF type:complete len:183 (+),score=33.73 gnl/MRDRNA2_/MRDRNA2_75862_c0_seq1:71-619(+)
MPLIGLFMKADLQYISNISFAETTEWVLDLCVPGDDFPIREKVRFTGQDQSWYPGCPNHKVPNLTVSLRDAGPAVRATLKMLDASQMRKLKENKIRSFGQYTAADSGTAVPLAAFECRGVEPAKLRFTQVTVETTDGDVFEDVNLADGEWWRREIVLQDDDGACCWDFATISHPVFEFRAIH